MCGACGANAAVSRSTMELNHAKLKYPVRELLNAKLGQLGTISLFGDRWMLKLNTGKTEIFADIEALVVRLAALGVLLATVPGARETAAHEQLARIQSRVCG